jgi:hypothetical protein
MKLFIVKALNTSLELKEGEIYIGINNAFYQHPNEFAILMNNNYYSGIFFYDRTLFEVL